MKAIADISVFLMLAVWPAAVCLFTSRTGDFYPPMVFGAVLGCSAASVLIVSAMLIRNRTVLRWNPSVASLAVLVAICFLSALSASYKPPVLRASTLFFVIAFTGYLLFNLLAEIDDPGRPVAAVAIAGAVFSLIAITQYYGFDILPVKSRYAYDNENTYRAYAFFGNPNLLADFIAISLPACAGAGMNSRRIVTKIFFALCAAITFSALFITHSRGALLAASAGIAVFFIVFVLRARKGMLPVVLMLVMTASAAGFVLIASKATASKQNSALQRIMTWKTAAIMVGEKPLTGVGFDRFGREYLSYQAKFFENPDNMRYAMLANLEKQRHAHNEYIQYAAETGIPGALAFLSLIIFLAARPARANMSTSMRNPLAASVLGTICAFFVVSFFSFPTRMPGTLAMIAILAASAAAWNSPSLRPHSKIRIRLPGFLSIMRTRIEGVLIIAMVGCLAFLDLGAGPMVSRILSRSGQRTLAEGRPSNAERYCGKAFLADKLNGDALYCLGLAGLARQHPDDALYFFGLTSNIMDDPMMYLFRSRARELYNDTHGAELELLKMENMVPAFPDTKVELAKIYLRQNRLKEATNKYREAAAIYAILAETGPRKFRNKLKQAECYYAVGDIPRYIQALEDALKFEPDDVRVQSAIKTAKQMLNSTGAR